MRRILLHLEKHPTKTSSAGWKWKAEKHCHFWPRMNPESVDLKKTISRWFKKSDPSENPPSIKNTSAASHQSSASKSPRPKATRDEALNTLRQQIRCSVAAGFGNQQTILERAVDYLNDEAADENLHSFAGQFLREE